ncbi:conserved exported hypothetical protein [Microbacterium sp. C448]|uniref:hypothetical protein n=1 Tax=Microbacterium sp. C448 TaxID=1177594 RepID=UPI0003DE6D81|nr:hypothetical protein [Microbacterium sp. C448]CDK00680.1 conserved exported hypothetical protein [Microbacterium sp. C448]
MNTKNLIPFVAAMVLTAGVLTGCQAATGTALATPGASASATPGSNSVLPVASNPISNTSTAPGLSIASAAVEDLVDPATGKAMDDRLQITLTNSTSTPLTNVEIYYQMTDVTTQQSEGYYMALDDVTIPAQDETTVYFDNGTEPGHFPENTFSLYRTSTNQVDFVIQASADGVQVATANASKGAGTDEQPD